MCAHGAWSTSCAARHHLGWGGGGAQHGDKREERGRGVVHEDVDEAVEQLSAPLDGDEVLEAVPHEEHRHPVVVHMEERELVLHTRARSCKMMDSKLLEG